MEEITLSLIDRKNVIAPGELEARKRQAADRYREAGADLVIDSILELPAAIDELDRRLASKEAGI